ncbi:uncharacterized protein LOC124700028 [Lolium rigidum]|uniref:uncharacterized protein LOC124700028 n=1 Tax=Lolium rigidum TaxID=89674 RepID=UPI001F5C6EBC|nr:uncharacterized protein LOC124700028 [Lolium rigidum]
MLTSLSAFVQELFRLLQMPTMPAWLSAFFQRSRTDDAPVPVPVVVVPARKKKRGFQSYMYAHRRPSDAELARNQEAADRILPPGPTIEKILAKDAQVLDPYEQKVIHTEYVTMRPKSGSEWDFCSACYFGDCKKLRQHKDALGNHFDTKHDDGGAWDRCQVCQAVFYTQQLKCHYKYCHPHIAFG